MFPSTRTGLRTFAGFAFAGTIGLLIAHAVRFQSAPVAWTGLGGNAQHTNVSGNVSAGIGAVKWSTPVDVFAQASGAVHYSGPVITGANTVVIGVKTHQGNDFRIEGHQGKTGATTWQLDTDYTVPPTSTTYWIGIYPIALAGNSAVGAGGGGTVYVKTDADDKTSAVQRFCFYQALEDYDANPATYSGIKINTPITALDTKKFVFGYATFGGLPASTLKKVSYGGIVRMMTTGSKRFRKAIDMVPSNPTDVVRPAFNSGPVRSNDGLYIYAAITNASQGKNYLVKLDANTLDVLATVQLLDPANGLDVWICPCSSASPVVGPDGHVFFGVLRNNDGTSHGWLLQFDANLSQFDAHNVRYPVGGFGWDDTPSIVPANLVKSYRRSASYLLLTKYNNYKSTGGDGRNRLAVLDPRSDALTVDRISGIHTMNEVITVLGVTCDSQYYPCDASTDVSNPAVPLREWCINAAVVDRASRSAIVNSEDGHAYRWDFSSNTLKDGTYLLPGSLEPYTPTAMGPDGTSYVINGGNLYALRSPSTP